MATIASTFRDHVGRIAGDMAGGMSGTRGVTLHHPIASGALQPFGHRVIMFPRAPRMYGVFICNYTSCYILRRGHVT